MLLLDAFDKMKALPIIEVGSDHLGERVYKQKHGTCYKGLCPMHTEKHASFYLKPRINIYICYGCGELGGPIRLTLKLLDKEKAREYLLRKTEMPRQLAKDDRFFEWLWQMEDEIVHSRNSEFDRWVT